MDNTMTPRARPRDPVNPAVGQRIRRLRLARKMTQRELAQPRYTKAYISALENGLIHCSVAAGTFLAERLGTSLSYLLEGDRFEAARRAVLALDERYLSDLRSAAPYVKRDDVLAILGDES